MRPRLTYGNRRGKTAIRNAVIRNARWEAYYNRGNNRSPLLEGIGEALEVLGCFYVGVFTVGVTLFFGLAWIGSQPPSAAELREEAVKEQAQKERSAKARAKIDAYPRLCERIPPCIN